MPIRLDARDAGFEREFTALLAMKREVSEDVDQVAAAIIADVRARGDAALIDYTERFDKLSLTPQTLRVTDSEIEAAVAACTREQLAALETARARIEAIPGAAELVAKHNGEGAGGGGLLGGLMSAIGGGGIMGLGQQLMSQGLGMGEISTLAKETMAVAREYAGSDVVDEVVASVPGLSQFV